MPTYSNRTGSFLTYEARRNQYNNTADNGSNRSRAEGRRRHIQLTPGTIIVHQSAPWRIISISEPPQDLWGPQFDKDYAQACAQRAPTAPPLTRATWPHRPVVMLITPADRSSATPLHLRTPISGWWQVLPEHYSVCVACGELPPCRHERTEREADHAALEAELLLEIPPGHCLACGEPVNDRQGRSAFPGPNLWRPDLGNDSAIFHTRQGCAPEEQRYRTHWEVANDGPGPQDVHPEDPTRPPKGP